MRNLLLLLTLAITLVACPTTPDDDDSAAPDDDDAVDDDDSGPDDDDVVQDDDDAVDDDDSAPPDDDDAADDDDDSASPPTGFLISYSFTSLMIAQGTCAEADQTDLWVEVGVSKKGPIQVTQFTCDDQPLQVVTIGPGTYQLTVTTRPGDPDVFFEAEQQATAAPGLTPLDLELLCQDPGIDDGCGGA